MPPFCEQNESRDNAYARESNEDCFHSFRRVSWAPFVVKKSPEFSRLSQPPVWDFDTSPHLTSITPALIVMVQSPSRSRNRFKSTRGKNFVTATKPVEQVQ